MATLPESIVAELRNFTNLTMRHDWGAVAVAEAAGLPAPPPLTDAQLEERNQRWRSQQEARLAVDVASAWAAADNAQWRLQQHPLSVAIPAMPENWRNLNPDDPAVRQLRGRQHDQWFNHWMERMFGANFVRIVHPWEDVGDADTVYCPSPIDDSE